ncbi:HD domain-containing protein [Streptomyces sp. NPDC090054]|uniref:HD domain-containing protein n=1 Tax=Streptomyces sp. NPDC090054 TaxID=3365933 RepID=UPI0038307312
MFAALLAEHEGLKPGIDLDAELLFHACVLHDLGASPSAPGQARFEVEGADMAARFLTEHGYGADQTDPGWEAIALHTSDGIAERRGVLAYLTRRGIGVDLGFGTEFVTDTQGEALHGRYPRLDMATVLVDDVVRQGRPLPAGRRPLHRPGRIPPRARRTRRRHRPRTRGAGLPLGLLTPTPRRRAEGRRRACSGTRFMRAIPNPCWRCEPRSGAAANRAPSASV